MNDVRMVPLVHILQKVESSVDFGEVSNYFGNTMDEQRTNFWLAVIKDKASDTGFGHLIEAILTEGFDNESSIGWFDNEITEGHHRLVAAILLGMEEVPVSDWGTGGSKALCAHCNCCNTSMDDPYPIDGLFAV